MKKSLSVLLAICLITSGTISAQGFLKKVTKSMTNELLGRPEEVDRGPEPACACDKPVVAMDMGGKLQLDYQELTISIADDGRILAKHTYSDEYYIVQNGITTGPLKPGDKRLRGFENVVNDANSGTKKDPWAGNDYITKSGEKYIITFGGKTYGPYGAINSFAVTKSKEKFAAIIVENVLVTEDVARRMEEEQKNAKTDQEKMDLAMKFAMEMQQRMVQGGGSASNQPAFVSNIPDANWDQVRTTGSSLRGDLKYDDVLMLAYDKIIDFQGNVIFQIKPEAFGSEHLFINTSNTKYAYYNYGTLTFSDNTTLSEIFEPYLLKENGQVYLAYMYYSPKKNSIMQCKIPF